MNQRMKELVEQCTIYFNDSDPDSILMGMIKSFDKEKFAKLMVEECIAKCQSNVIGMVGTHASAHNSAIQKCINSIKEHFGVEE